MDKELRNLLNKIDVSQISILIDIANLFKRYLKNILNGYKYGDNVYIDFILKHSQNIYVNLVAIYQSNPNETCSKILDIFKFLENYQIDCPQYEIEKKTDKDDNLDMNNDSFESLLKMMNLSLDNNNNNKDNESDDSNKYDQFKTIDVVLRWVAALPKLEFKREVSTDEYIDFTFRSIYHGLKDYNCNNQVDDNTVFKLLLILFENWALNHPQLEVYQEVIMDDCLESKEFKK
uniref:Uncharacterized protein n=1 Tax=Trachysalambria curvirostris majanivirus TaxID=2984281 RepID=A0A9C7EYX6_9VIRU|nr:MAG: hypothetical protein [Trachysalambria curvirostris majanivirus]